MNRDSSQRKHRRKRPTTHRSHAFKRERNLKDLEPTEE